MEIWYEIRQSLDPVKLMMIYNPWKANPAGKKQTHLMAGTYSPASHLWREARRPALRTAIAVNGALCPVHLQGTETHPVHVTVLQAPEPWGQRRLSPLAPEREAERETELASKHQSLFWLGHGHILCDSTWDMVGLLIKSLGGRAAKDSPPRLVCPWARQPPTSKSSSA